MIPLSLPTSINYIKIRDIGSDEHRHYSLFIATRRPWRSEAVQGRHYSVRDNLILIHTIRYDIWSKSAMLDLSLSNIYGVVDTDRESAECDSAPLTKELGTLYASID